MLIYLQVNLYCTLLPTILLYLLMRPLMSNFDKIKLISISVLVIIYTSLWLNYIAYHKALLYRKDAVIGTIGYVPIEEYLIHIIQVIFTTLWTSFCTRWTLNSLFLKQTSQFRFQLVRFGVIAVLIVLMCLGWIYTNPETKTFYLGSMIWWSSLPLIVLWYFSGPYACKRHASTLISVIVTSIYFCSVNVIAMRAHIRQINESACLGIFIVDGLPLEEFAFFVLTNVLIVLSSHAFDKFKAIIDTYCIELFPVSDDVSATNRLFTHIKMLLDGSLCNEQNYDSSVINDLESCSAFLNERAKSFSLAHKFFPNDISQDLTVLYSFSCVTDDMIDEDVSIELKNQRLQVVRTFFDQLFSNRRITSEYCWKVIALQPKIDWPHFEELLSNEELCIFRCISRIAYYLPQEPFYELLEGYKWDAEGRCIQNESDLIEYSERVASSIGTLMTFIYCHRSRQWPDKMGPKCRLMLENARKMSVALQIYNNCRDIITDSETLGRCYIPKTYLIGDDHKYLVNDRNPHRISNVQLKRYAEKLLDLADNMANEAIRLLLNLLPDQCCRAFVTKLRIYMAIGKIIRNNLCYERRTKVSEITKICIALKCMYFTSMASMKECVKIKVIK